MQQIKTLYSKRVGRRNQVQRAKEESAPHCKLAEVLVDVMMLWASAHSLQHYSMCLRALSMFDPGARPVKFMCLRYLPV